MNRIDFDNQATQTIRNLCTVFNKEELKLPKIISPYSVGLELEIKFKYFFPEISNKYFIGRKYWQFTEKEKEEVTKLINEAEAGVKNLLEKTLEAGIPKGTDRYWEFAFNPVYDLSLIIKQIEILKSVGLIPNGEHSLHINVGDLKAVSDVYYILMTLELLYLKKERIIEGFPTNMKPYATWSKKGYGGVMIKNQYDLLDTNVGFEFRSLCLYDNTNLFEMLSLLKYFLDSIQKGEKNPLLQMVKEKMLSYDLPDKNWKKPWEEPEIWKKYIEVFDEFSVFVKNELKHFKA